MAQSVLLLQVLPHVLVDGVGAGAGVDPWLLGGFCGTRKNALGVPGNLPPSFRPFATRRDPGSYATADRSRDIVERGPRDAEFKHRCYPKARDLAAFFLFRPEAPTFFFLGALGFRLGGS